VLITLEWSLLTLRMIINRIYLQDLQGLFKIISG